MFKTVLIAASLMGFLAASLSAQTDTFKVNYFSNANCGPSTRRHVRITNVGTQIGVSGNTSGDIGAAIFVFNRTEELAECCRLHM